METQNKKTETPTTAGTTINPAPTTQKPQTTAPAPKEKNTKISMLLKDMTPSEKQKYKKLIRIKEFLNSPPPPSWIKKHPIHGNYYVPIDKVEAMLDAFFLSWSVKVLNIQLMINCVTVHVELKVIDFNGNEIIHHGVGAEALQVNKDANPLDTTALKQNAVVIALPKAKTEAIKDAAHHLGKIFGRDVNRKDIMPFESISSKITNELNETSDVSDIINAIEIKKV